MKVFPQEPQLLTRVRRAHIVTQGLEEQNVYIFMIDSSEDSQKFLLQPPRDIDEETQSFNNVAVINRESSAVISQIVMYCTLEASCLTDNWSSFSNERTSSGSETCNLVDIIIYGHPKHCDEVGDILNAKKIYLQEPDYRDTRYGYKNPHFLELNPNHPVPDMDANSLKLPLLSADLDYQQLEPSNEKVSAQTLLKQKLAIVFNSMTRSQNLKRVTADTNRVHTILKP